MHWLAHVLGLDNPSGPFYLFHSGFGPDVPVYGTSVLVWRKLNCHAKGCWRIGRHHVTGTHFVTCARHHPVHDGKRPATAEQIAKAHKARSAP